MAGIPLGGRAVDLTQLQTELIAAGIVLPAIGTTADALITYDAAGDVIDPPPAAVAVIAAHTPSTALRDQLVSRLTATVGVALQDLTNAQLLLVVGALLYKQGALNRQGQIRPLNAWLI